MGVLSCEWCSEGSFECLPSPSTLFHNGSFCSVLPFGLKQGLWWLFCLHLLSLRRKASITDPIVWHLASLWVLEISTQVFTQLALSPTELSPLPRVLNSILIIDWSLCTTATLFLLLSLRNLSHFCSLFFLFWHRVFWVPQAGLEYTMWPRLASFLSLPNAKISGVSHPSQFIVSFEMRKWYSSTLVFYS